MGKPFDSPDLDLEDGDSASESEPAVPTESGTEKSVEQEAEKPAERDTDKSTDPLTAALAVAESISPLTEPLRTDSELPEEEAVDDTSSLMQVIDRVGQHIEPDPDREDTPTAGVPEELDADLDALDIQAELGPPDMDLETGKHHQVTRQAIESEFPPLHDRHSAADMVADPDGYEPDSPLDSQPPFQGLRFKDESRPHGILTADPIWQLLGSAHIDQRSGVIIIESGDIERKLYLDNGDVIVATSTAKDDRLVDLLYREGRLDDDEYRKASKTVGTSGRKVGAILVERGLIASRELFPLVRHHYESIICDSFSWNEGIWRYDPEGSIPERILLETKTPALILEGIRTAARPDDIAALAPIECRPISLPKGICDIDEVGLVIEEMDIYRALDGTQSMEQLAAAHDIEKQELQKLIAGLAALGWVQANGTEAAHATEEDRTSGGETGYPSSLSLTRSRVNDKLELIREGTYFALLEIKDSASGYEIRKAYKRLKAEFALERFAVSALADIQPQAETIFQILTEAYEVLRDPARREAYRQGIKEIV